MGRANIDRTVEANVNTFGSRMIISEYMFINCEFHLTPPKLTDLNRI